jgi:hypothetical protein
MGEEHETGGTCNTHEKIRNAYKILVENLKGTEHLEDLEMGI